MAVVMMMLLLLLLLLLMMMVVVVVVREVICGWDASQVLNFCIENKRNTIKYTNQRRRLQNTELQT